MELQGPRRPLRPSVGPFGGEKEQMLNLNQRLESYLNRVKLLDEENAKLVQEIQALRGNHHGDLERRRFLDGELRKARREVEAMWKERVYAEVDVARLTEELESLGLQLQMETKAQAEARAKADQSRKELEEERRAQMWLREKVNQLEHEMKWLIQTHQEEVDHMEALLMQPRATRPAAVQQGPNLLELGQEYSQRAARAWQEAAQAYQGQLSRLEESVNETRQKLVQAGKEKSESVLKLQNLDRELLGLQDLREHLETTVDQQRESHCRDVQMLQEHLEDLERERHELGLKMDQLLQENRGLAQMKMSLNMEVATFRALLDSDSLKGDINFQKQPRNIYSKDAVFSPWGVKDNYQISPSPKTTSTSMVRNVTGRTKSQTITTTPTLYQKYVPRKEILEISAEKIEDKKVYQQAELTPYPKVLKNGAVENFRPQEVLEKVTYAEPLSPQDEEKGLKPLGQEKDGEFWNDTVDLPFEERPSESEVSHQEQTSFDSEAPLEKSSQFFVEPALTEEPSSFSIKSELLEVQIQKENYQESQASIAMQSEEEPFEEQRVELNLSHRVELVPDNEEPINKANRELEEPFTEDSTVVVQSEMLDVSFEKEEIVKPQARVDTLAQMKYNITEQLCEESNFTHQIDSVPKTDETLNEVEQDLVEELSCQDAFTATVKSELKEILEKPQTSEDTRTEVDNVNKTEKPVTESDLSLQVEPSNEQTSPELVKESYFDESCPVVLKSEWQKLAFETDESERPQAPTDAWTEEKLRTETNLSHEVESGPNNEKSFNETSPELAEEQFIDDSVKSQLQKLPSEDDESEKPEVPKDAWTKVEYINRAEKTVTEPNPERFEEPCSVLVKSELQKQPSETDETEKPQAPIDAWVEKESFEEPGTELNLSHEAELTPTNDKPFSKTGPELVEETYTVAVRSEIQRQPSEKEDSENPQSPTDAWTEEKVRIETNLSHYIESRPSNEVSFSETSPELVEETCSVAAKSELQEQPSDSDESEKHPAPTDAWTAEKTRAETNLCHPVESGPNNEVSLSETCPELVEESFTDESYSGAIKSELQKPHSEADESEKPQVPIDAWSEEECFKMEKSETESNEELVEEHCSAAVKSEFQKQPSDETEKPQATIDAWIETESTEVIKHFQEEGEYSNSETEAFVEPNFDTKSSSLASEESLKNQLGDIVKEDFTFDSVGVSRDDVSPPKEKLYPDGEEMDTWDSVIEENPEENAEEPEEATRQHAEPEEDMLAKEARQQKPDMIQEVTMETKMESQTELEEQNNLIEENLQDESQEDEQEDSQNVSVSWRTELEGDSYAQDNTLADTRPLIRYKSDDTDANTQASHVDDVDDSSDSEQDKKVGEMVSGAWTEDKTRKFGTMEDLCEEVEGEVLDEEYDLEYLRKDGMDDDKENPQEKDDDSQMEEIKTVVDEELDTDKLVEQELENLTTEWYTTHFALNQASEKDTSVVESFDEQPKAWTEALKETAETFDMEDFLTSEEVPQPDKEEAKELVEAEEDNLDISTVTHCDTAEDFSDVQKELVCPSTSQELSFDNMSIKQKEQENMEERPSIVQNIVTSHESQSVVDSNDDINQSDKPTSTKLEVHPENGVETRHTTQEEIVVQEEDDTNSSTPEQNVGVENPMESVDSDKKETISDLTQKGLSSDDQVDRESLTPTEESINASPEHTHEDTELFIVKDSKALLKTNCKANLDDLYSIGGNDDFWMSPLETGATYQPVDVDAKHMQWKLGFGGVELGESENVLSESDMGFEQKEVLQIKSVVKGEVVHSEESDDDSEVMFSDDE